jgi:hypothetical protein
MINEHATERATLEMPAEPIVEETSWLYANSTPRLPNFITEIILTIWSNQTGTNVLMLANNSQRVLPKQKAYKSVPPRKSLSI